MSKGGLLVINDDEKGTVPISCETTTQRALEAAFGCFDLGHIIGKRIRFQLDGSGFLLPPTVPCPTALTIRPPWERTPNICPPTLKHWRETLDAEMEMSVDEYFDEHAKDFEGPPAEIRPEMEGLLKRFRIERWKRPRSH